MSHPLSGLAACVGEPAVHVEEPDVPTFREPGEASVDVPNDRKIRGVVAAREDGGEDDRGVRRFLKADVHDGLDAARDLFRALTRADVVRAREDDDDLGVHAVEFAVLQSPEDVLGGVGAPAEVGSVPAEEVHLPIGVGSAPKRRRSCPSGG